MAFTSCGTCYSFPIYLRVGGWVGLIARWVLLVQGCLRWTGGVCEPSGSGLRVCSLSVGQMYCLLLHEQWFINDVIDWCYMYIYIFAFIVVMICVWCHSKFWSMFRPTMIHFVSTVYLLHCTVIPSYSVLEQNQYSATLVTWVVLRNYNSSSASRDFLQFNT